MKCALFKEDRSIDLILLGSELVPAEGCVSKIWERVH
jgi:hypothetical protein